MATVATRFRRKNDRNGCFVWLIVVVFKLRLEAEKLSFAPFESWAFLQGETSKFFVFFVLSSDSLSLRLSSQRKKLWCEKQIKFSAFSWIFGCVLVPIPRLVTDAQKFSLFDGISVTRESELEPTKSHVHAGWTSDFYHNRQFKHQTLFATQTQTQRNLIVKANQMCRICHALISHWPKNI